MDSRHVNPTFDPQRPPKKRISRSLSGSNPEEAVIMPSNNTKGSKGKRSSKKIEEFRIVIMETELSDGERLDLVVYKEGVRGPVYMSSESSVSILDMISNGIPQDIAREAEEELEKISGRETEDNVVIIDEDKAFEIATLLEQIENTREDLKEQSEHLREEIDWSIELEKDRDNMYKRRIYSKIRSQLDIIDVLYPQVDRITGEEPEEITKPSIQNEDYEYPDDIEDLFFREENKYEDKKEDNRSPLKKTTEHLISSSKDEDETPKYWDKEWLLEQQEKNITQREVADKCGVSKTDVSQWERKLGVPREKK